MTIAAGTQLGRYEIRSQIGAGGMGEVYLAKDTRLERTVALKILPADVASDEGRMLRFTQEARAASALSHPNVAHIYEIEEANGIHFIAMEYIEGRTLRQHLKDARLSPQEALDIATQAAAALSAAHAAGIVHRDIKPENIMLRPDGYVKVLDFGLAKLTERRTTETSTEAPTKALVNTDPGTVMGTATYMSPEQARGSDVDARTDIWSLGIVLYEMVAGRAPFEATTTSDTIASILTKDPPPLARFSREVPEALELIVSTSLAKDREERYQTAKEMLGALRRLKQRMDVAAEMERSSMPEHTAAARATSESRGMTSAQESSLSGQAQTARTTSSAEVIISEIKRHKRGALLVLAGLIAVIAGVIFGLYKLIGQKQATPSAPLRAAKLTPITTHGRASAAAISPDGKYVAYSVGEDGKQSLWLRQVATASSAPIVPMAEVYYFDLTFSRDGNFLYYAAGSRNPELSGLYQITLLGQNQRRLIAGRFFGIALSPDGTRIALVYRGGREEGSRLIVANADGSNEQTLASRKGPGILIGPIAWSPDGRIIALTVEGPGRGLKAVSVEDGDEKPLFARPFNFIRSMAWLPDGSGLIVSTSEAVDRNSQLWRISYPGGEESRITNDLNDYDEVSVTADSSALVTMQESISLSLWIGPKGDGSGATQIPYRTGKDDGQLGVAWTREGKIVYTSTASGSLDLWIMDADGGNQKQLTFNAGRNVAPAVSPDSRYIVFASNRAGQNNIWRMNPDGSAPKQLASKGTHPQWSADGKWVVYLGANARGDWEALWKVPIEGGAPVQLTDEGSRDPAVSPDGKLIAYSYRGPPGKTRIMPIEGGPPSRIIDLPPHAPALCWTPDGRALTYVAYADGVSNIWSHPLDGSPPKQITDFKAEQIRAFDWSRDGRLVVSRGVTNLDVVLISGFR